MKKYPASYTLAIAGLDEMRLVRGSLRTWGSHVAPDAEPFCAKCGGPLPDGPTDYCPHCRTEADIDLIEKVLATVAAVRTIERFLKCDVVYYLNKNLQPKIRCVHT